MPHYRNGALARVGDLVIHSETYDAGDERVMIVQSITPGSDACNAKCFAVAIRQKGGNAWMPFVGAPMQNCVTLKECDKAIPDFSEAVGASGVGAGEVAGVASG